MSASEQILVKLRPAFSREAPFEWFVLLPGGVCYYALLDA